MERCYRAHGLDLLSSFPLAGTPTVQGSSSPLRLERVTPEELKGAWTGPSAPRLSAAAVFADRRLSVVERGAAGDVRYRAGASAVFRLDPAGELLQCCPLQDGLAWQRALVETVLPMVSAERGYELLAAGGVVTPAGAVAIAAGPGGGRTTVIAELLLRGCELLADSTLVLKAEAAGFLAHPGTPHLTVPIDEEHETAPRALGTSIATLGRCAWVAAHRFASRPARLAAVFLLDRRTDAAPDRLTLEPVHAPASLGARIGATVPCLRLLAGAAVSAARIADLLEDALAAPVEAAA